MAADDVQPDRANAATTQPPGPGVPSFLRLVLHTLLFHGRTNLAVACGVAAGAAVLTGALLVGDSMRGSLRHLALDRLGDVDAVVMADHFFRASLAEELTAAPGFAAHYRAAVPAILLRASVENPRQNPPARANRVNLIGCDEHFWRLESTGLRLRLQPHEVVLNRPLAEQLGVQAGDAVLMRLPRGGAIPADTPLGKKEDTVVSRRVTVAAVIPAAGLGQFSLRPTQQLVQNAYVSRQWLAEQMDCPQEVNTLLVTGNGKESASPAAGADPLESLLHPAPADGGLNIATAPRGYVNITSDRMFFSATIVDDILRALRQGRKEQGGEAASREAAPAEKEAGSHRDLVVQPALTYLANTIAVGDRTLPYSTVTALNFTAARPLGPFVSRDGKALPPLKPDEIALNAWAADELHAAPGDTVRLTFFAPESHEGQLRERTVALRLAAIVAMSHAAVDRGLTPPVKGITDEFSMADWDPPFPFDAKRIRPVDEEYWRRYGPTPKAFVSLATGRELWGSRFGDTTSLRVAGAGQGSATESAAAVSQVVQQRLTAALAPAALGFQVLPVRARALAAAAGSTPFGVLFLSLSFFVIAAAVMLVALLFRLAVEQRAVEIGTLLAVGWTRGQVRRLLLGEGFAVAGVGCLLGLPLGAGYAALMLVGLRTWWLAAIVTPFLRLYIAPTSLVLGGASALFAAMLAIAWSTRQIGRVSVCGLLAGQTARADGVHKTGTRPARRRLEWALLALAVGPTFVLLAIPLSDDVRMSAFFAVGATSLAALLLAVWLRLAAGRTGPAVAPGRGNLARLALRNAARNPGRSALSMGLVAAAAFLIMAVSAFHLDPHQQTPALHSGNGGFALVAESEQPILQNLNTPAGRAALGFSPADERELAGSIIYSARVQAGDDATCLNLYQARQPRVLGLSQTFRERGGFAWAAAPADCDNPWTLLEQPLTADADGVVPTPVIMEKNTANYALHLWGGLGDTLEIADGQGRPLRLRVVALLATSILQGDLLIGDQAFLRAFPEVSGYRFFLVETPPERVAAVRQILTRDLGDYGLAVETTGQRLAALLAVQNTYLSTFQSLGGLGLLLGTLGLAAVQLRNIFERRGELALLRATGFDRRSLGCLILFENVILLGTGLLVGVTAALLAVLPEMLDQAAAIPWASLAITLLAVLLTGVAAGELAVRAAVRAPLLTTLRRDA